MGNALERLRENKAALDAERRLMNEALGRLGKPFNGPIARQTAKLIFGLDLTASREPGLQQARIATASMFDAIRDFGSIEVKLAWYRGTDECRETPWYGDADILRRSMLKLSCKGGNTQIAKLLRLVLAREEKVSAVVFVGDHCEEEEAEISRLAHQLRARNIPVFLFHEWVDDNPNSHYAKGVFERIANTTGGVYVEFKPDSGEVLKELLPTIAAFSTAGVAGIERLALPLTMEARQLRSRLLLSSGGQ